MEAGIAEAGVGSGGRRNRDRGSRGHVTLDERAGVVLRLTSYLRLKCNVSLSLLKSIAPKIIFVLQTSNSL